MPKVKDGYFENKKKHILEAAFSVCMKKPVYDVTMKDVVIESGLSQGGVYKYFSGIDDIFVSLINRINQGIEIKDEVEGILKLDSHPEYILHRLFRVTGIQITDTIIGSGKIYFELTTVFSTYPNRYEKIREKVITASNFDYLIEKVFEFIREKIENGYFKPTLPFEDIISFIIASCDGIIRDVIISKCYQGRVEKPVEFNEKNLINTLFTSTVLLLGGDLEKGKNYA